MTVSGRQQNQARNAWIGSDSGSNRIGSEWYFRFWCRRIILRKAVFNNETGGSEKEIRVLTTGVKPMNNPDKFGPVTGSTRIFSSESSVRN